MEAFPAQLDSGGSSSICQGDTWPIKFIIPTCLLAGTEKDNRVVFGLTRHLKTKYKYLFHVKEPQRNKSSS